MWSYTAPIAATRNCKKAKGFLTTGCPWLLPVAVHGGSMANEMIKDRYNYT